MPKGNIHLGVDGHVVNIIPPVAAGNQTSDYFHLRGAAHVDIVLTTGAVTNATTVTVYESQTSGATVETAIVFSYYELTAGTDTWSAKTAATVGGISLGTGNNRGIIIAIDAADLTSTYDYIAIKTSTAASCLHSAIAVLGGLRYAKETPDSAID